MGKRQQAYSFLRDFKDVLNRGNVVDLAVVSLVMGALLQPALKAANGSAISTWPAGAVLVALINCVVISFVVFVIIRALGKLNRREPEAAGPNSQQHLADAANRLTIALERRQL
ncbi:large conductance mechanosensitive channel protein MscL [Synechococcus sp. HJ21-Hayes]|jgi:large conductance mechanosensitive channel|uniref:MscL family protein n=1 Tax=Synechococcus sp. HJ21-Hayes TaxID=2823736 RepID=UPI0020CF73DE|nr:MscL family protein [Synechococcus sp. HJ21-Hayes]MCP9853286.1 large conductance mechanosensitive channel protein MscL [Synechococcus sp. HJ21-Hayes]